MVGTLAGVGTGVLCRRKLKKGLGISILSSILTTAVGSAVTYGVIEATDKGTGIGWTDAMFNRLPAPKN